MRKGGSKTSTSCIDSRPEEKQAKHGKFDQTAEERGQTLFVWVASAGLVIKQKRQNIENLSKCPGGERIIWVKGERGETPEMQKAV